MTSEITATPRTSAVERALYSSGIDRHHDGAMLAKHARELEVELNAMNFSRPYDTYWSRRALAAERKLAEQRKERAP